MFSDVKVNDLVYVVWQKRRFSQTQEMGYSYVTKVGRKYCYIEVHGINMPFFKDTGFSSHGESDCNARSNGYGFDVYPSEADYIAKVTNAAEKQRLQERLIGSFGILKNISHSAVMAIHEILNKEPVDDT